MKRILILGLLPRQFEAVRRRIGARAELVYVSNQGCRARACQQLEAGVAVVVNTRFVKHHHTDHIDPKRTKFCNGGDSTVTRAVEELLAV